MRWAVALILLAGCRQLLGFESPAGVADGPSDPDVPVDLPGESTLIDHYAKTIAIDPAKVTGSQVDFPVFVRILGDPDLQAHATATGADIQFTKPDGTPLAYEIAAWDPIGSLEAWVKLDLDDTLPTAFELRYGGGPGTPDPAQVFSSAFMAVWHFESATTISDATGTHAGTVIGSPTASTAKLGVGLTFDGTNDRISFVNNINGNDQHTISAWVSVMSPSNGFSSIVTLGSANMNQARFLHTKFMTGLGTGFFANDRQSLGDIDGDGFRLVHWTFANGTTRLFIDGQLTDSANAGNVNTNGSSGNIGGSPVGAFGNNNNCLRGTLDEVRIATAARSVGWIATEFANQSSPATFYAVGTEQTVP